MNSYEWEWLLNKDDTLYFFPLLRGMEMMENLSGLPHSHTPPHTPFSPPTFSLSERKIFFLF